MPLYEYKCSCGNHWDAFHSIEFRDSETCECGLKADRVWAFPQGRPVVYEYFSENLDAQITGPRQKQRVMKEKDVSESNSSTGRWI